MTEGLQLSALPRRSVGLAATTQTRQLGCALSAMGRRRSEMPDECNRALPRKRARRHSSLSVHAWPMWRRAVASSRN
jgi:hypothetical protein